MHGSDTLLRETVDAAFRDLCTPETVRRAEQTGWAGDLWRQVVEMGLTSISIPEDLGGSGGTLADALAVLQIAGRYALPLPLAEAGILGSWLTTQAGLPLEENALTIAPGHADDIVAVDGGRVLGKLHRVPWARSMARIAALVYHDEAWHVAVLATSDLEIHPMVNLAGEPRDTVVLERVPVDLVPLPAGLTPEVVRARGALSRVALISGALQRIAEMTVEYTSVRRQFGKPVGSFQAVQHHLVHCAQQSELVALALQAAAAAATEGDATFEIAAAKTLAGQGVTLATRAAHQAHGAMGMTQEYGLQQLTRRLWAWREEYGFERAWARKLGEGVQRIGADNLYPLITGGTPVLVSGCSS